mmetsp:Transcript_31689/g.38828  ORF Transcript_31689/g.38828 Transcript_31689/m.38828 type:complete len:120 (+) Transcript_31689:1445-1804(+)
MVPSHQCPSRSEMSREIKIPNGLSFATIPTGCTAIYRPALRSSRRRGAGNGRVPCLQVTIDGGGGSRATSRNNEILHKRERASFRRLLGSSSTTKKCLRRFFSRSGWRTVVNRTNGTIE